jgi:hypothetical protein
MRGWKRLILVETVAFIAILFFLPVTRVETGFTPTDHPSEHCVKTGFGAICYYGTEHFGIGSVLYWAFRVGGVINGTYSVSVP